MRRRLQRARRRHRAHAVGPVRLSRVRRQRRRCSRRRSRATPGSAGSASTRNLIDREAGSWFFLGEIFTDLPLPVDAAGERRTAAPARACIDVCPTRRDRRALPARRAPLHLLSDDRAARRDSRGAPRGDRQPHLRLRRLPARVPVEQVRAHRRRSRISAAPRARRSALVRAVRVDRSRSSSSAPRAARSAASVTSAGCATSRSRWAMRRRPPQSSRRWQRGATMRPRSCASTWLGARARSSASPSAVRRAARSRRLSSGRALN